jgi:aryl-alcohol dehydrogenase-like predicted oxidoreductase
MITGKATAEGTAAYAAKHASLPAGHWRPTLGLTLSSLGMGTYLGNADPVTDGKYAAAAGRALELGLNILDSAINYRFQRSERNVGTALKKAVEAGALRREEVLVCTKGGYIAGDWGPPTREWFEATYLKPGVITVEDIVAGSHCMAPAYLKHEVDQSRANLGLETLDVYYVHNPETQIQAVGPDEYYARLTAAFRALEECAAEGKIQWYGTSTWNAYRTPPGAPGAVSLEKTLACARAAGGENHRFKVVQLPFNFALPEALLAPTQEVAGTDVSALEAASALGLTVFTSVPLMQGQLLGRFSRELRQRFPGLESDAQRCLQFARSTPGLAAPLCGMKSVEHVEENAKTATVPPFSEADYAALTAMLTGAAGA